MYKYFKLILAILMILGFIMGYVLGDISSDTTHLEDREPTAHELLKEINNAE